MNSIVYGNRIQWPYNILHWELRRYVTLNYYGSETFEKIFRLYQSKEKKDISFNDTLDRHYYSHTSKYGVGRLLFYETSMPAKNYRRVSEDFKMTIESNYVIGAYIRKGEKITKLTKGVLLSVEDTCHTVLTLLNEPIGLNFGDHDVLFLRPVVNNVSKEVRNFYDYDIKRLYESGFNAHAHLIEKFPSFTYNCFFCVSSNVNRQVFADNLSIISLLWIIGHEDAHSYSGHISRFESLGISDQDFIFNELINTPLNGKNLVVSKAAEMEADMCSTFRTVDYCYDSELYYIMLDWLSIEKRTELKMGRKERDGLNKPQRLILMRMISLGCIIPIITFSISSKLSIETSTNKYPSLICRFFNHICNQCVRIIATTMNYPDHGIGGLEIPELINFIKIGLDDFIETYQCLFKVMQPDYESEIEKIVEDYEEIGASLIIAFLGINGKLRALGVNKPIRQDQIHPYVFDFLHERWNMENCIINEFYSSKKIENPTRATKVEEDISLCKQRKAWLIESFDFFK